MTMLTAKERQQVAKKFVSEHPELKDLWALDQLEFLTQFIPGYNSDRSEKVKETNADRYYRREAEVLLSRFDWSCLPAKEVDGVSYSLLVVREIRDFVRRREYHQEKARILKDGKSWAAQVARNERESENAKAQGLGA